MEFGNLLFGHIDPLEYTLDRNSFETPFKEFLVRNGFDEYGHIENRDLDVHLKHNKVPGYVYREVDLNPNEIILNGDPVDENTYNVNDEIYIIENEELWDGTVENYVLKEEKIIDDDFYFENDIFVLRPYYWGDCDAISEFPNFVYKPENIVINWYKYPLRDAQCSVELSKDKFEKILKECEESL